MLQIRIHGRGGQGVVTGAVIAAFTACVVALGVLAAGL